MVKVLEKEKKTFYQCEECGFLYSEKEIAEKCEAWCKEHRSCNIEIIKYGIPPSSEGT